MIRGIWEPQIIIRRDAPHQVELDLLQSSVYGLSINDAMGLTGRRPSSAILCGVSACQSYDRRTCRWKNVM
jgi:hypothetical protein